MGRARDLANILSSSGSVALDSEMGLSLITPTSVATTGGSGSISATGAVTFSGASTASINGCFTSTYSNYRIVAKITSSASSAECNMRLRASGTDNSSAIANSTNYNTASGTSTASTYFRLSPIGNSYSSIGVYDVQTPFDTDQTRYTGLGFYWDSAPNYGNTHLGGAMTVTTSYDGFTLYPNTGTISGTIRVYGYRN